MTHILVINAYGPNKAMSQAPDCQLIFENNNRRKLTKIAQFLAACPFTFGMDPAIQANPPDPNAQGSCDLQIQVGKK